MLNQRPPKMFRVWSAGALSAALIGCSPAVQLESSDASASGDRPLVVVTSSVLCDLVQQIAADTVDLACLLKAGLDPHVYTPSPSDRQAIEQANLILYGGYSYEPDLIQIIKAANTAAPKIAVIEAAVPDPILSAGHEHEGEEHAEGETHAEDEHAEGEAHSDEEHAAGEEHAEGELAPDPHVWHDPKLGIRMVEVVQQQLEAIAPAEAERYAQNAQQLTGELSQLNEWIVAQVATVPTAERKLVTSHDSFRYFADAYGFEVEGTISGLSTEERPTANRIAELVDTIKDAGVPTVFVEKTTNRQWIDAVAKDAGVQVAEQPLYVEGPDDANSPAPTYQAMLVTNTCTIVNGLGGQCDAASAPIAK